VKGWDKAHLSEIEAVPGPGTLQWTPVRRHFDIAAFGINAYTAAEAGQDLVERHTEAARQHEEAYVVLSGRATFTLDGEDADAPAGTIIFIRDPAIERSAVAMEPGTTLLAVGAKPGAPYSPGPWEPVYVARALGAAGDYEGAIAELKRGLEIHPEHRMLLYRLANWEALAGKRADALNHLAKAVAESEALREQAQTDEAFDAIRDDPSFPAGS
jgi:tetratricopeptide (TPR) repeat protein